MEKTDLSRYKNNQKLSIRKVLWFFVNIVFFQNPLNPSSILKVFLLRFFGTKTGVGITIKPKVNIKYPWLLEIGNHVWIGEEVWIDNLVVVKIGNNVCLSQGVTLLTGNHNYKKSSFDLMTDRIVLEDGVWICAKAVVCSGVICRSHSVLTIGSVITKNMEKYCVYQGNPAVLIRKRIIE